MIEKIKESNLKEVPILVLSAHNEVNYFIESIKAGINGYLLKPIDIEQFVSSLCQVAQTIKLKKELEKKNSLLEQYQHIVDQSSIVSKTDPRGIITYANDKFCQISKYKKEELMGKNHNIVRHPDVPKSVFKDFWHTIKDKKKIWQGVIKNRAKDGSIYYVSSTVGPILDKDGNIQEYIALRNVITDIMDPKKRLQDFIENTKEAVVAYLKVDDFEDLQFFYGVRLSMQIEDALKSSIVSNIPKEAGLNVFALGGGDFVIVKDLDDCNKDVKDVKDFFKNLHQILNSQKVFAEEIGYDISLLMSLAYGENALNDAKYGIYECMKNNKLFIMSNGFSQIAHKKAEQNIRIIKTIKNALTKDRIISLFQPIVNNKTGKIEKYESLVRIMDENDQFIPPDYFLDIAKKGMFYSSLTSKILANSFAALKMTDKDITINISAYDIEREQTKKEIYDYLEEYHKEADRLVFELLESEEVVNFEVIKDFIKHVKSYGVKIAIDDFGSGYSNLKRLIKYNADIIKIDGSLIQNIEFDKKSLSIIKSFLSFAKEQGIQTVGEFVENENIYLILKELGMDYSQGYYFGKPQKLEDMV
jgi:PAS domain S-box-containing protein